MSAHPKFCLVDAGLFRSLRPIDPFDRPEELAGAALEGLVAEHLRTWIAYAKTRDTLSYWRTRSGSEVDFVLYGESGLYALEVKNAAAACARSPRTIRKQRRSCSIEDEASWSLPCDAFLRELTPARSFSEVISVS